MPDAATHILIQILLNQFIMIRKILPYTLFGAVAPDLLKGLGRWLPPQEGWLFYPTHSPIFMLIFFYALSLMFHKRERYFVIIGCFIGMLIHLVLDIGQINLGGGYYMPFFPISFKRVTLGFYETEASIFLLPLTILITIIAVFSRRIYDKKSRIFSKEIVDASE